MATNRAEAEKQGLAWWDKDSIVEIWLHVQPSDPNTYRARCLTSGTFPKLEVLNDYDDQPHERYTEALLKGEYAIWKVLPSREYQMKDGEFLIIVGDGRKKPVRVIRKGSDETVKDGFASIEEARDWIIAYDAGEEHADDEVEYSF